MYKLVIYNNNFNNIKLLFNTFLTNLDTIKISGVVSTPEELELMQINLKINMIIISEDDFQNESISPILEKIKYKIIFSKNSNLHKRSSKYTLFLPTLAESEKSYLKFQKFIQKLDKRCIYKKIHKLFEKLNFDFKLTGTNYLAEVIVFSYLHKDEHLFENLEKNIYPHIAKKFGVDSETIKWSIIRAVNNMNNNNDIFNSYHEKLTPKTLIYEILTRL